MPAPRAAKSRATTTGMKVTSALRRHVCFGWYSLFLALTGAIFVSPQVYCCQVRSSGDIGPSDVDLSERILRNHSSSGAGMENLFVC